MPKREAKKSRAQEEREKEEAETAAAAASKGQKMEPEPDEPDSDEDELAKHAPAVFDPPERAPAKAAEDDDDAEDGSEDGSEDDNEGEDPKAAEAEPAPPKITYPVSMAACYKEILQGAGFKGHEEYPDITDCVAVDYCPICSLPPDFCIWGPSWDKCKPSCMEKFPYFYPDLAGGDLGDAKQKAQAAMEKSKMKELPGGKKTTRAKSPEVQIRKNTRGGRKCVTSISGLEGFGVKPEAAAKLFKKKFACGSAAVKGDQGQPDTVDIQGDFEDEVIQLLVENFKEIPRKKITIMEGGKVKGRK